MNERGFSLLELLVGLTIIGILASIAIPGYLGVQKRGARSEAKSNLQTIRLLQEQFFAENDSYTADLADVAAIQAALPGFQPGSQLNYSYSVTCDDAPNCTQFTAVATPLAGIVSGDFLLTIDEQNVRQYEKPLGTVKGNW